ncbi:MAG: hypothetical protein ACR2G5_15730 [Pyrinomonadaceae bacterium]
MSIVYIRRLMGILFALSFLLAAFAQPRAIPPREKPSAETARLLAYDRSTALDLKEDSAREQDGVLILDVISPGQWRPLMPKQIGSV